MRLNRLDLTRYGKFTDHVIDFGSRSDGKADLHIVYGPNEAGKSTLFNGWLDLLFGIGAQSSYNFLHPYPTMRIGAAIDIDGETREFVRIKRPQNSLFDGRDQPVPETALLAGLGGLGRDGYRTMFSLDDETLEQGGESILASRGDLGELLFSASAGLGDLSQQLAGIRSETEEFYKPRAQKRILGDLKAELAELKAERDRIDTQASRYAQLTKALEEANARHAEASAERRRAGTRLAAINRLLTALPRLGELDRLHQQIEPLAGLPDVAPDWRAQIGRLRDDDATLEASRNALAEEIERLTTDLDAGTVDDQILALQGRISDLDRLRTRHDTAEQDLPERRLALGRMEGHIEQLLARLGRSGKADDVLLDTARTAALRDLIDARSALDGRLTSARKEASDAKAAHDEALAELQMAGGSSEDTASGDRPARIAALSETLTALRNDDHRLRKQAAERAIGPARDKCAASLQALAPWQGDIAELAAMRPPSPATLRSWKSGLEETARGLEKTGADIARLTQSLRRHEAEAGAIAQSRALLSTGEFEALRAARDAAWTQHAAALDIATAKAFETAMQAYDAAADKRAAHQADVAKLNEISVQIAITRSELEGASTSKAELETARAGLLDQIATALSALSPKLPADMSPDAIESWLGLRELALEADQDLRARLDERDIATRDQQAATDRLLKALAPLGVQASDAEEFDALIARAQDLVSRETRLDAQRRIAASQERMLRQRQHELRAAEDELQAWILAWKTACDGCWLGEPDRVATAAEVREALPLLTDLGTAIHDRSGLADRVAKMERDQADYAAALADTARAAGIDPTDIPVNVLARQLSQRLAAAQAAQSRHDTVAAQIEAAVARQRAQSEAHAAHRAKKTEMLTALNAETLTEAALCVDRALERKALGERLDEIRDQIRASLDAATFEEAQAQLDASEPDGLNAEKSELEARLETLDADVQELHAARTRATEDLNAVGGDDAVARIEQQRKTIHLAIAEGAERYLKLSAGIIAMEQALTLYRERHRSSMMARASEAVRIISRGRYTGLASQPDKDRELLIALQNDGSSKQAAEMSKGARFQLYLALRVAGYHEFAETRQTVPFIADDIMETFDDFRAEETFRLFAEMAGVGQVIYLTHHKHLCDIAKTVCPDVKIHELTA
ncbi:ATP-binding protein [Hoeflea ulvae]|uniref:AAA family ATPase n=1 Tax=Hoeflea ulvae TaxID=2983764 RepID=A0ABT3YIS0_9HYPH|nr:AAA family ATPase [Hoeflea ulvae]MCY0095640.1 AAA family ATPase [Hoeflea ulvae]